MAIQGILGNFGELLFSLALLLLVFFSLFFFCSAYGVPWYCGSNIAHMSWIPCAVRRPNQQTPSLKGVIIPPNHATLQRRHPCLRSRTNSAQTCSATKAILICFEGLRRSTVFVFSAGRKAGATCGERRIFLWSLPGHPTNRLPFLLRLEAGEGVWREF